MAEPAEKEKIEKKIIDHGLEIGAKNLSEERIKKVIDRVLKGESGARLKAYVDTCIHCGLCSEACHYYLSHDNDPCYSPVGKVKQTLWEMIKNRDKLSAESIKSACEIAYTQCNLCKRCAMYCPFRNRHCLPDPNCQAHLSPAGCSPAVYSGYGPQPCNHHEPDVGQR
jgi:ferredoxin